MSDRGLKRQQQTAVWRQRNRLHRIAVQFMLKPTPLWSGNQHKHGMPVSAHLKNIFPWKLLSLNCSCRGAHTLWGKKLHLFTELPKCCTLQSGYFLGYYNSVLTKANTQFTDSYLSEVFPDSWTRRWNMGSVRLHLFCRDSVTKCKPEPRYLHVGLLCWRESDTWGCNAWKLAGKGRKPLHSWAVWPLTAVNGLINGVNYTHVCITHTCELHTCKGARLHLV